MTVITDFVLLSKKALFGGNAESLPSKRILPPKGSAYLAGEYPSGITSADGVPTSSTVRVLYRPASGQQGDGVVVAEVKSAQDGTWRVDGLHPDYRYDVVGRLQGFNDVIMSNVAPKVG